MLSNVFYLCWNSMFIHSFLEVGKHLCDYLNSLSGKLPIFVSFKVFLWGSYVFLFGAYFLIFSFCLTLCFCVLGETAIFPSLELVVLGRLEVYQSVVCAGGSSLARTLSLRLFHSHGAQTHKPLWQLAPGVQGATLCILYSPARSCGAGPQQRNTGPGWAFPTRWVKQGQELWQRSTRHARVGAEATGEC